MKTAVEESAKSVPAKTCIIDSITKQTSTGCQPNGHLEFLALELGLHFYMWSGFLNMYQNKSTSW